ncbi:unnamed protein product, partial [Mesorhabditis spiculigera]
MYTRTRQPSGNLRKISEINEQDEAIEQHIVFNPRENGFTVLRKLSERLFRSKKEDQEDSGHESDGRTESEADTELPYGRREGKEKHHGKVYNMLRWVATVGKKKSPAPEKQ